MVERRIHFVRNTPQHRDLLPDRGRNVAERETHLGGIRELDRVRGAIDARQHSGADGLDLHVHENEPVLVVQVDEVLQRVDVAEGDRGARIEALPVVERVTVVAEDGRTLEQRTGLRIGRRVPPDSTTSVPPCEKRGASYIRC